MASQYGAPRTHKSPTDEALDYVEHVPPHHIEAEQAAVAAMLVDKEARSVIQEVGLEPRHFYRDAHGRICKAIYDQAATGEPVDLITIRDHLTAAGALDEVGGYGYLVDLASSIPTTAHARHYATIVRDKWLLREQIRHHSAAIADAYEPTAVPQDVADAYEARKAKLTLSNGEESQADTEALIDAFYANLEARKQASREGKRHLLEFGLLELDNQLGGLERGDFVILGARPSMGKTACSLNMFYNVSAWGRPHFYSLEMDRTALMNRIVCMVAEVDSTALRTGNLTEAENDRVATAIREISQRELVIDDGSSLTLERLRRSVLKDVARGKRPPLVIVDYLQLMNVSARAENRTVAMGELSRGLKQLAREAQTVIVALSQLSRACESRTDRRPLLSDLRESGNIEQDADVAIFLYRDEYYNPDTEAKGLVELNVAKYRNGQVGSVSMYFDRIRQQFLPISLQPSYATLAGAGPSFEGVPYGEFE